MLPRHTYSMGGGGEGGVTASDMSEECLPAVGGERVHVCPVAHASDCRHAW